MTESKQNGSGTEREQGFQFPGEFEITAIGSVDADLQQLVLALLKGAGLQVDGDSLRTRPSRRGNYLAVTVSFHCDSRIDYEAAHHALRASEHVRYTH